MPVRGNCEAEVDQMVLQFPVLADYMLLFAGDQCGLCNARPCIRIENHLPPLKPGDVLLHGHTHVLRAEERKDGLLVLNPGFSVDPEGGQSADLCGAGGRRISDSAPLMVR